MASSSSAKKVARVAAKSGSGNPSGAKDPAKNRNWIFGISIVLIVALGIGIVLFARDQNVGAGDNTQAPKANLGNGEPFDHWHAAFAVNVCGTELSPVQDGPTDIQGIHTHNDGLIHIHPFTKLASGERATMARFFKQVGFTVTDTGFQLPEGMTTEDGGTTVKEGVTTCGGEPGELVMAHWKDARSATGTEPDQIFRSDFSSIKFTEDGGAYTLAFVKKGSTDIAAPSTAAEIESLGAVDGGAAPTDSSTVTSPPAETPATTVAESSGG